MARRAKARTCCARRETRPGSLDLRQNTYLLRKDGVWVLNLAIFALPEAEQEVVIYPTIADAMTMMTSLSGGEPVIEFRAAARADAWRKCRPPPRAPLIACFPDRQATRTASASTH